MKLQATLNELDTVEYRTRPELVRVYTAAYLTEILDGQGTAIFTVPKGHSLVIDPEQENPRLVDAETLKAEYAPTRPKAQVPRPRRRRKKE